jgi:hypothetical protein
MKKEIKIIPIDIEGYSRIILSTQSSPPHLSLPQLHALL